MLPRITPRALGLLTLCSVAACGTGRVVPADTAEPAGAGAPSEPAVSTPAPGTSTEAAPVAPNAPADPNASGYAPSGSDTTVAAPAAPTAAAAVATPAPGGVAFRRVGQWSTSGITAPARLIIRDDSAYAQFWSSIGPGAGARPSVDFTRDIVIAVAAGQQATGGHTIAVDQVSRVGDGLAVRVLEITPAAGCNTTQAVTQPVDVVVVAAAGARTWSFSDHKQAGSC